jgi:hypothetical protein
MSFGFSASDLLVASKLVIDVVELIHQNAVELEDPKQLVSELQRFNHNISLLRQLQITEAKSNELAQLDGLPQSSGFVYLETKAIDITQDVRQFQIRYLKYCEKRVKGGSLRKMAVSWGRKRIQDEAKALLQNLSMRNQELMRLIDVFSKG